MNPDTKRKPAYAIALKQRCVASPEGERVAKSVFNSEVYRFAVVRWICQIGCQGQLGDSGRYLFLITEPKPKRRSGY